MQSKNIARHRTPTSVKASDVQHACNFAQGKAWWNIIYSTVIRHLLIIKKIIMEIAVLVLEY